MKTSNLFKTVSLSLVLAAGAVACGMQQEPASKAQSLHGDHEIARQLIVKCNGKTSAESQLALELSKTCREQNAELRAKGFAACQEDFCSEVLQISAAKKGLNVELQSDGNSLELHVKVDSDLSLATQEQKALICYAPVLKARELLNTVGSRCQ